MKEIISIFYMFLLSIITVFSQNEGNIWYFGTNAGLDFNSGSPIMLADGMLNTFEGCATISDSDGDLLFYTDGMVVYNKNHVIMPNGSGLLGNSSSTQSGIIVKKPSSNTIYYIFTVDGITGSSGGFYYSEVDMSLQGGLGDINANKNIQLFPFACEKVTAILHQNGSDFWIVSPPDNSGAYNSYLLTSSGLDPVPVVTNIGSAYTSSYGYLRASPDGDKIVSCFFSWGAVMEFCLYDFDRNTGVLSNEMVFTNFAASGLPSFFGDYHPYGAEFSPSGRYLYIADENSFTISQYDLLAGSYIDISNSQILLVNNINMGGGALQLGPDNKIYATHWTEDINLWTNCTSLSVINSPDLMGLSSDVSQSSVSLGAGVASLGLPTFYSSIFLSNVINVTNVCYGDSAYFVAENTLVDSLLWDFGDVNSGESNFSVDTSVYHTFSDTGNFDITLYSYLNGVIDTSSTFVYINPLPIVDLGIDTAICDGDTCVLNVVSDAGLSYLWHDNSILENCEVYFAGDYYVIVTDTNSCVNSDTVSITTYTLPNVDLGDDQELCVGDSLLLDVTLLGSSYLWNDNYTNPAYYVSTSGVYSVVVIDSNGCANSDTVSILFNPSPDSDFSYDPARTYLNTPTISFTHPPSINTSVNWDFGDGVTLQDVFYPIHIYDSVGQYDVSLIVLNDLGCVDTTIYQVIIDPAYFTLFIPNSFTPNNDNYNDLLVTQGTFIVDFNIKIFNLWGSKLFESNDLDKYWDGTFQGEFVQQGKYTYLVEVVDMNGIIHEFTDIVNLIH